MADSEASTVLGVSNVAWGFLFYLTVAVLAFGRVIVQEKTANLFRRLGFWMVAAGFLYSVYLTIYQAFKLQEFCALCLTSALTVTVLFILNILAGREKNASGPETRRLPAEIGWFTLASFVGVAAIVGTAFFVNHVGSDSTAPEEVREIVHQTLPDIIDPQFLTQMAPCSFTDDPPPLANVDAFIHEDDAFLGSPDAPLRVIDFFDPNCPHCKTLHETLLGLSESHLEKARIYYRPFPIWGFSMPQVQALYLARDQEKFFEMLDAQFERQQQGGLDRATLVEIAEEIELDTSVFRRDMRAGKYLVEIQSEKEQILAAGVNAFPRLAIEGKFVPNTRQSMNVACIGGLIDQEYAIR